jgi:RNA polymerase sigma factor (sigma-70 family)
MTVMAETRPDGRLLEEFAETRSPEAFEELVRRYNALVTGVCRRIVASPQDAEEVTQAVFLTLAHKARSLSGTPCVAGWLHHVARDLSRNALKAAARRRRREEEAATMKRQTEAGWNDVRPVLDQALDALPEKYRVPLILHYLQEKTQEDIAQELGCQVGTISTWLHRGRELLRGRLARSGVAVSGALLATLLTENAASAAVSAGIVSSAAAVTPQVVSLMQGGLNAMAIAKLKVAAAIVLSVGMAGTGAGVAYQTLGDRQGSKADLTPQTFAALHALIRPQPGEWRHLKVDWITDVIAARRKAATEDKPMIVLYTGGAGYNEPLGVC